MTALTPTVTISATVYATPSCTRCPHVIKQLTRFGITPQIINIDDHDAARRLLVDDLGLQEVPLTVVTGLFDHPVAFTGHAVDQLLAVRSRLKDLDVTVRGAIDSAVGINAAGLPVGVEIDRLHKLDVNGNLTPVNE